MFELIVEYKEAILMSVLCIAEISLRVSKTKKPASIITGISKILDFLIPDKTKDKTKI